MRVSRHIGSMTLLAKLIVSTLDAKIPNTREWVRTTVIAEDRHRAHGWIVPTSKMQEQIF